MSERFVDWRQRLWALAFLLPTIAFVSIFVLYPFGRVIYYAFTDWDGISSPKWVGFDNFRFLWEFNDFHRIFLNTLILVLGIVLWTALPFTMAIIISGMRRANLIRTLLFIPILLPPVIVGGLFRLILARDGPLNETLRDLGLGFLAASWISDERVVLISVIFVIAWAVLGGGILVYSAGLAAIPPSRVEAAQIEGATWWQTVWHVYRPALRPVTRFWTLFLTVATVTAFFPWIFGLTQGGPGIASTTVDYAIYRIGIAGGRYGLASAIAVVAIVMIVALVLFQLALARVRRVDD